MPDDEDNFPTPEWMLEYKGYRRRPKSDYFVGTKRMLAHVDPGGRLCHFEQGVPVYFPGDRHPTDNPVGHVIDERKTS